MAVKEPNTGQLNKSIQFLENNRGSLGLGKVDDYHVILSTRCYLENKTQVREDDAGQVVRFTMYYIYCWYQVAFDNAKGSWIGKIDDVKYIVHGFVRVGERKKFVRFEASKFDL